MEIIISCTQSFSQNNSMPPICRPFDDHGIYSILIVARDKRCQKCSESKGGGHRCHFTSDVPDRHQTSCFLHMTQDFLYNIFVTESPCFIESN
jgi:hypothetical protein